MLVMESSELKLKRGSMRFTSLDLAKGCLILCVNFFFLRGYPNLANMQIYTLIFSIG